MKDNDITADFSEPEDATGQIAALQRQVFILLLALIVLSGTVAAYLYYQSRITGKEIAAIRPRAAPILRAFQERQPAMQKFIDDLRTYSQRDANFRQILKKYGVPPPAAPAATKK
jgi:hypothetical protein